MIKQFFIKLNRLFLLGAKSSSEMSQEWAQNELSQYEDADRKAAGINL